MATLTLEHVSVAISEKTVVSDVSCTCTSGTVTVLMGPNGSGKSSLVNALMGHLRYSLVSGSVRIDAEDIAHLAPHERARRGLFVSPQHTPKVSGVTLTAFLHRAHGALTGETLDILDFYLRLREIAHEYHIDDRLLDRPLTEGLSGGERKLVEALQLAVLAPRAVVLDEVDAGVDVDRLETIFAIISATAARGASIFLVSHHPSLLKHCNPDRVHVLMNGAIAASGGVDLAARILAEGYCGVLECPLRENCASRTEH